MATIERNQIAKGAIALKWVEFKRLLKMLEADEKYQYALLFALGCMTGFRISDLLSVEWKQVLNTEYLTIKEKKTGKVRTVKLNLVLQGLIQKYYKALKPKGIYCFEGKRSQGTPFTTQYINKILKQIKATYPIDHVGQFSSHTFRKTFGKRMYDQASDKSGALINLSKIFNHSGIDVTREYIGIEAQEIESMYDNMW